MLDATITGAKRPFRDVCFWVLLSSPSRSLISSARRGCCWTRAAEGVEDVSHSNEGSAGRKSTMT